MGLPGAHQGEARHLANYLDAWFPILASVHGRVVIMDGFAGRGVYAGGSPGSPIIALRRLLGHSFMPKSMPTGRRAGVGRQRGRHCISSNRRLPPTRRTRGRLRIDGLADDAVRGIPFLRTVVGVDHSPEPYQWCQQ